MRSTFYFEKRYLTPEDHDAMYEQKLDRELMHLIDLKYERERRAAKTNSPDDKSGTADRSKEHPDKRISGENC